MARFTETIDLREERDRLDEELDAIAEEQVELEAEIEDADGDDPAAVAQYRANAQRGNRLETAYAGVEWALDPDDGRDPIEEVTLGAVSAGEYAVVGDRADTLAKRKERDWGKDPQVENARRNEFAAACLQDAPFIDAGDVHADRAAAVSNLAPQFITWLEMRGDELSTPDVSGNSFATRVAEKR